MNGPRQALDFIAPGEKLRPLGDRILVKPLAWDASRTIIAIRQGRPVRGIVKAVGPGCHPKKFQRNDKGQRVSFEYAKRYQPTEVKVGEVVELGGLNIFGGAGYMFPEVIVGGEVHLLCQEADVCLVRDDLAP